MNKGRKTPAGVWLARIAAVVVVSVSVLTAAQETRAQGPQSVADIAAKLTDSVVNISTAQNVAAKKSVPLPSLPPDPRSRSSLKISLSVSRRAILLIAPAGFSRWDRVCD